MSRFETTISTKLDHDRKMDFSLLTENNRSKLKETVRIFGVNVDNINCQTAMGKIRTCVMDNDQTSRMSVFFANVHTIHLAKNDPVFKHHINNADLVLPDGSGLKLAGKLFRTPIIENLNGTDFTPKLLGTAMAKGWSVYLLGALPDVIEQCQKRLLQMFPQLKILGYHDGYSLKEMERFVIEDINVKQPDILLTALGSPLQEEWISKHFDELNVRVCLGVGGLFDFIAGSKRRAPVWMRNTGIEWIYRFLQDPSTKWQRVFVEIPLFLSLVAVESIRHPQGKSIDLSEGVSI
ncbi:MAG: WecB/TagA/CpsF family glycosyltransferase [Bacteroidota bacterium]